MKILHQKQHQQQRQNNSPKAVEEKKIVFLPTGQHRNLSGTLGELNVLRRSGICWPTQKQFW